MKLILGTSEGIHGWDAAGGLTLLHAVPGVRALARARPDASTLYAAADERQVLRSDDGGRTWRTLPPAFAGFEISSLAADSPRSTVREQVANGVSVRMAALYLLLSGERSAR